MQRLKLDKIDVTQTYPDWLKIGCSLADEFGEGGRGYFHTVSQYHSKYSEQETDRMFDNVLKHGYNKVTIASFFKVASDYGIKIQEGKEINPKDELKHGSVIYNANQVITLPKIEVAIKQGPWSNEIAELESFFKSVILPDNPIRLNQCSMIVDVRLFLATHLSIVKAQNGNLRYLTYLNRLREFKNQLN